MPDLSSLLTCSTKAVEHVSNVLGSLENGHVENVPHVLFGLFSESSLLLVVLGLPPGPLMGLALAVVLLVLRAVHFRFPRVGVGVQVTRSVSEGGRAVVLSISDHHRPARPPSLTLRVTDTWPVTFRSLGT